MPRINENDVFPVPVLRFGFTRRQTEGRDPDLRLGRAGGRGRLRSNGGLGALDENHPRRLTGRRRFGRRLHRGDPERRFPGVAQERPGRRRRQVQDQPVSGAGAGFHRGFQNKGLGNRRRCADIENDPGIAWFVQTVAQFPEHAAGPGQRPRRQPPADLGQINNDSVGIAQGKDAERHLPVDVQDNPGDVFGGADADIGDDGLGGLNRNRLEYPQHDRRSHKHSKQ